MPQHSVRTQPPICDMTGSGHPQVGGHHHHHHPLEGRTLRYVYELFLIMIKKTREIKIYTTTYSLKINLTIFLIITCILIN